MRRALVPLVAVAAALVVGVGVVLTSESALVRVWPHLPRRVQMRPSLFLTHTLHLIRTNAARRDAVDWPAVEAEARRLASGATTTEGTYPAIRHVLAALGDGHSRLIEPAPSGDTSTGVYGFQTLFPDRVVAVVYPESAAAAAGVRAGDVIALVNGAPPAASADPRTRGRFVSVPPPSATLRLRTPGDKAARDIALRIGPYVPLPALTRRIGGDLGYVEIPGTAGQDQFAERVRESIAAADAPAICGWIVDLRFNNGGSLGAMLQTLRAILGDGPFGSFVAADGRRTDIGYPTSGPFALPPPEPPLQRPDAPVAVLLSRLTANSGEVLAIAFRGRPGTRTFGEPTWGGPTENTPFRLADDAVIDLATARVADRSGTIHEGSLAPDERVAIDWARLTAPDDPVIVAAGTWLRAQPACQPPASPAPKARAGRGR